MHQGEPSDHDALNSDIKCFKRLQELTTTDSEVPTHHWRIKFSEDYGFKDMETSTRSIECRVAYLEFVV